MDSDPERGTGQSFLGIGFSKIAFSTANPSLVVRRRRETMACTLAGKKMGIRRRADSTSHRTVE